MSIDRAVLAFAGLMVLLSLLLTHFVHPYFIGLSGFVGAGLIFARVTDFCGMWLLLAR